MVVKALRILLAVVVLIMSVANVLFIAENWSRENIERATTLPWVLENESGGNIESNEVVDRTSVEGTYLFLA